MIFLKKLNASTKQKTKGEVVAGTLTGIAAAILKLGIISVAVIGVNMLMAGGGKCAGLYRIFNAYSKYLSSYRRNNHLYVNDSYA